MVHIFKVRLHKWNYPNTLINNTIANVKHGDREKYLQTRQSNQHTTTPPPLYIHTPPPQYRLLKQLVLQDYHTIYFKPPRFITFHHPTLQNMLVCSHQSFINDQLIDVILTLNTTANQEHKETTALAHLRSSTISITSCQHPRCMTCRMHLLCSPTFKSNYPRNRTLYHIRHSFSCKSTNIVNLITCTKCRKQYVGCTTKQLNTRINHHRSCINNHRTTFIHKHFNLPDHSITHLQVQPISTPLPTPETINKISTT